MNSTYGLANLTSPSPSAGENYPILHRILDICLFVVLFVIAALLFLVVLRLKCECLVKLLKTICYKLKACICRYCCCKKQEDMLQKHIFEPPCESGLYYTTYYNNIPS